MNKFIDIFSWQRFIRVFVNDVTLLQGRRLAFSTLSLFGVGMIVYLSSVTEVPEANQDVALTNFGFLLLGGGLVFTSMIFNDMHHPLERFHYLTLPYSNLERFVSRYLITAPLYLVYAIVLYKVFERVANFAIVAIWDGQYAPVPLLNPGTDDAQALMQAYFATHVFVYAGAIWFRSYSLIKTVATSTLFWTACTIVMFLAVRIIFWDSFISFFEVNPEGPYFDIQVGFLVDDEGMPTRWMQAAIVAFLAWVLYLAYLGLKEHEVQDGI